MSDKSGGIVHFEVKYGEIAEHIAKTGGWADLPGRSSFAGHDPGVHRIHILPETVESHIETCGQGKDFGLLHLNQPYRLADYPRIRVKAINSKTMLQGIIDLVLFVANMIGSKKPEPGAGAATDTTSKTNKNSISERFSSYVKNFTKSIYENFQSLGDQLAEMFSSVPDLYYRQIPRLFSMIIPGQAPNNYYDLPLMNVNQLVTVNGDFGWTSDGFISRILGMACGFINTPVQPFFVPETGMGNEYPAITVSFPLFNDTLEHAQDNYKFIHTILPWNMWVQWGIMAIPAVIYDITVDSGLRMAMCTADMNVSHVGAMREVDPTWKDAMGEVVTIPDVYVVTCSFRSLLNSNFNNYLLSFEGENNDDSYLKDIGRKLRNSGDSDNLGSWQGGGPDTGTGTPDILGNTTAAPTAMA